MFVNDRHILWLGAALAAVWGGPLAVAAQSSPERYEVIAVEHGSRLTGRVVFRGDPPRPGHLLITRDLEVCGEGYRERRDVDVGEAGELRGVVVFLEGISAGKAWPPAPEGYTVDQKQCTFLPGIQVVPRGAELHIINSDPVLHNIHAYEVTGKTRRTLFNLGQPEEGVIDRTLRVRRGEVVSLECDAHDFMLGWIFASDDPYAVVVDEDGRFMLDEVPPGTYTVKAWHPELGMREHQVKLRAGGSAGITFEFAFADRAGRSGG